MEFLCSKCGACCRLAGGKFGLPDRGDGACSYLNEDNTCSIYNDRPEVCRIGLMATKKLAIFDAFEILNRIEEEEQVLKDLDKPNQSKNKFQGFAEGRSK